MRTKIKVKGREYRPNLGGENKGKWTFDPGANVNWFVHRERVVGKRSCMLRPSGLRFIE